MHFHFACLGSRKKLLVHCFKLLNAVLVLLVDCCKILTHFLDFIEQVVILDTPLVGLSSYLQTQCFVPHIGQGLIRIKLLQSFLNDCLDFVVVTGFHTKVSHACLKLLQPSLCL